MPEPTDRAVTGSTHVAGVIGWPTRHSLSPTIMNAAFAATGLDWIYLAFEVAPDRGAAAIDAMRALGLAGLSVTMPHKVAACLAADELTPVAAALGAANCVYWAGGRLVGDNTDGAGFLDALRVDEGVDPAGARCVVVGAGGAGRAVIRALAGAGAREVIVVNRTRSRAERAAEVAGAVGRVGQVDDIAGADLVVNATSVGMDAGGEAPDLPFDPGVLSAGQVLVDLIYRPLSTPLLKAGGTRGARCVNGVGMLVHQAAHAFRRWTGQDPPVEAMTSAVLAELSRRADSGRPSVVTPAHGSTGIPSTMQPDGKDS